MTLSDFIRSEVDALTLAWESFARSCLPAAQELSSHELRDHCAELLQAFANDIEGPQSPADQQAKSRGPLPKNSPEISAATREHALQRFGQGFTLNQLVAAYRALRASVSAKWAAHPARPASSPVDDIVRYGEAVDRAMGESVAMHTEQVESSWALLLGALGHDLRNPLGAVRMSAEYLLLSKGLDASQLSAVMRIVASADTMKRLIEDLLDLTQAMKVRTLPLRPEASNLGEICSAVMDELFALHPGRSIRVDREGDLSGVWDKARVGQLISNLASNAIQYGTVSRPVHVAVTAEPDAVSICIHNDGAPISAEVQATLFKPAAATTPRCRADAIGSSGLSLGLYIAHEIVIAHLGSIDVTSTAAEGTTFTVRLPRTAPPDRARGAVKSTPCSSACAARLKPVSQGVDQQVKWVLSDVGDLSQG